MKTHTLVHSTNRGRFALDDSEHGQDITSGYVLDVRIGGHWIAGRVEHASTGYYFQSTVGDVCGLCTGMKVRMK